MEDFESKKKTVNWTKNLTSKLIELYESHSNLWDVTSMHYKNRIKRRLSINEISDDMGIPVKELNDKIHNLRCQFLNNHRRLLKIKNGQTPGDNNLTVKWEFYDALKFIDRTNETNIDSLSNENGDKHFDSVQEMDCESPLKIKSQDSLMSYSTWNESPSPCIKTPSPSLPDETPSPSIPIETSYQIQKPSNKKRKHDLEGLLSDCFGLMTKQPDSYEIFGDYIADELRNMSIKAPELQALAKRQIQRAILDMNDLYDSRISADNILGQDHAQRTRNAEPIKNTSAKYIKIEPEDNYYDQESNA